MTGRLTLYGVLASLCAAPAACALTVTANAVSPTQVILSYLAPDNQACTVEVSESSTYSPLVHDVDGNLFNGANLDFRQGNLASGISRTLIVGTRSIQLANDGRKYSRALQQNTLHYFRITCNGAAAIGTFTTRSAPFGSTYADLPPVNSDGTPNVPTTSTTIRSEVIIDPQTGVAMSHVNLPADECTGCGNTYRVSSAGGFGQWCSDTLSAQGNYHCLIPGAWGWNPNLYAINPTTGAVTFLGAAYYRQMFVDPSASSVAGMMGPSNELASFDPSDSYGNTIYNQLIVSGSLRSTLVKWVYTGNDQPPSGSWAAQDPPMAPGTVMDMLGGQDLNALAYAFNTAFDGSKYACQVDGLQLHYAMFHCSRGEQGSAAWEGVYDVGNGLPLGAGGNGRIIALTLLHANAPTRWCTDHAYEFVGQTAVKSTATDPFSGQAVGNSPYSVVLGTPLAGYPIVPPGAIQTISVSSAGLINSHTGSCTDAWSAPPRWTDGEPLAPCQDHFLQAVQAGDILQTASGELIQIQTKRSPTSWDIVRGIGATVNAWPYPAAHNIGDQFSMYCEPGASAVTGWTMGYDWWNFVASPDGSDPSNNIMQYGSHPVSRQNKRFDSTYLWGPGPVTNQSLWGVAPPYAVNTLTTFAGTTPNEGGNTYQKHPSMASGVDSYVYDSTYFVGGNAFSDNMGSSSPPVVTAVSGTTHVYRYNPFTGNSVAHAINPKTLPILAKTQSQYLVDVSAPGRMLSDADDYASCYAYTAGECASGSSAGQIYFSLSTLNPGYQYCTGGEDKPNVQDICIGPFDSIGLAAMQYKLSTTSPSLWRTLSRTFTGSAVLDLTHNGEFAIAVQNASSPAANAWLLKVPPDPGSDGIDRSNFVPATLLLTPPPGIGISAAQVKFWYAEQGGTVANPYCTSRREACVAVSSDIDQNNPFSYAVTDRYAPAACAVSCVITIPVYPLHTAYYSVEYLDSNGRLVMTSRGLAMENTVVPMSADSGCLGPFPGSQRPPAGCRWP